jgi:tRNA (cmo5U34)-methyltransferase
MGHSVANHLNLRIADYDRIIRTFIPGYDAMRVEQLELLAGVLPADRPSLVLDLGGGTGALAAAVAERFPLVEVEIWDTDPEMLAVAAARCAPYGDRVRGVAESFAGSLSTCDAVVACIALHHVKDLGVKGSIYANIRRALRPGGLFANADCCMATTPWLQAQLFRDWTAFMATQGIGAEQAQRHFAGWAREDYYPPVAAELRLLAEAGFAEPDVFWRNAPLTVFGGVA